MARLIFIFAIIVVYFLTTVSKTTFAAINHRQFIQSLGDKDTIYSIFKDDFEDGNLSDWKQTTDWEASAVEKISGGFSLKPLVKTENGTSTIFHQIGADWNLFEIEWSLKLKNGKWDPSSSNKFWFYLSADTILPELVSGYALGVNISGSDDLLCIWRIKKGKADSLIVQSDLDWNSATSAKVNVKRSSQGNWILDYQLSEEGPNKSFSGVDPANPNFKNLGCYFKYSASRSGQLWLDDISVNLKPSAIGLQKITVVNSKTIAVTFNKPIDPASINTDNFKLTDENNQTIPIIQITPNSKADNELHIQIGKQSGTMLSISISGICGSDGKPMSPEARSFAFSFPPEVGSVLINEVLFNTFTGGSDFVELVNVSEIPIPIHRLRLATRDDTLALKQISVISSPDLFLKPMEYLTCTKNPDAVIPFYLTNKLESFCKMSSFPSMLDDEGTVVLLNDSLTVIDEFSYSAKMHSSLVDNENGVSLERISLSKPTTDRSNWASTAASVGFATPGIPNSQAGGLVNGIDQILPETLVFSPNGDGTNDLLTIQFNLSKPGYVANVRIFDVVGRQVKFLIRNQSLAQTGSWAWNGESDSGSRLRMGVYIIVVELFDREGRTKTFKKACTLTDRLN